MANRFETMSARLAERMEQRGGVLVTYHRGGAFVEVTATVGSTTGETGDAEGFRVETRRRDYLIQAAVLILDGELITPERGDLIKQTIADVLHTFEAVPLGAEPHWRWSDDQKTRYRIHVQEVDSETVEE